MNNRNVNFVAAAHGLRLLTVRIADDGPTYETVVGFRIGPVNERDAEFEEFAVTPIVVSGKLVTGLVWALLHEDGTYGHPGCGGWHNSEDEAVKCLLDGATKEAPSRSARAKGLAN